MTDMLSLVVRASITRPLSALLVAALLAVFAPSLADAAQFSVTSAADDGPGSLRQALFDAVATPGNDDVVVQPALGLINVFSELSWSGGSAPNAVTIEGNGVRVDFNGAPRGFVDLGGVGVTVRNMEITGVGGNTNTGSALAMSRGIIVFGSVTLGDTAPVVSQGGAMVIEGCTIFDNHPRTPDGDVAGAVLSEGGPVTVTNCTFRDNTAEGPFDASTVLSQGGTLTVSDSLIENNSAQAGSNSGGGLQSEGGNVVVTNTTINCNRATASNGDAAGGLLSEGGTVTVSGSTFVGNVGTALSEGLSGSGIVSDGPAPVVTTTTINADTTACGNVIASFFLPKRVKVTINTKDPSKSRLVAAGFVDTGPDVVDLASAASLDVGGFHFDAAALTPKRKGFILQSGGTTLTITPKGLGSSRAKFKLITVGDFTGKIDPDGQLDLRFANATVDGGGTVKLTDGKYTLGKVRGALIAPNLYLARVRATLKGPGKDALSMLVGLATGGTTPADASDVTIGFGNNLLVTIPAASFTKKGDRFLFEGDANGITKVVLDYAREKIAIVGKKLDLGNFAEGGNRVIISVGVGTDVRAVAVRTSRKGATMKY